MSTSYEMMWVDALMVPVMSLIALIGFFGKRGVGPGALAVMLSWHYRDITLGLSAVVLILFVVVSLARRGRKDVAPTEKWHGSEVIDAEFTVQEGS